MADMDIGTNLNMCLIITGQNTCGILRWKSSTDIKNKPEYGSKLKLVVDNKGENHYGE